MNPEHVTARGAADLCALIGHREAVQVGDALEAVHRRFAEHQQEYMAVLDGDRFIGLCARREAGMTLGARFGLAMYSRRPVRDMMLAAATQIMTGESPSGVWHKVFALPPDSVGIFICDVMGHGVRSALVTAMLRPLVQELGHLGENPGELLTRVNSEFKAILKLAETLEFADGHRFEDDVCFVGLKLVRLAGNRVPASGRSEVRPAAAVLV